MSVRAGYTYCNTSEEILASASRREELLAQMRREADMAMAEFADRPEWISGWGHDFVCPRCAAQLEFDIHGTPYGDHSGYRCPVCGEMAYGIGYDDAWVYFYRYHYAKMAESVATCAAMGDGAALEFLIHYVDFYADNYEGLPYHTKRTPGGCAGMGKIMAQSLCEAVWALSVIRALSICRDLIGAEKKAEWYQKLFHPLCDIIIPQAKIIHNIPTWIMCAVGAVGIYFVITTSMDKCDFCGDFVNEAQPLPKKPLRESYERDIIGLFEEAAYRNRKTEDKTFVEKFNLSVAEAKQLFDEYQRKKKEQDAFILKNFFDALEILSEHKKISTAIIQAKLRIGYGTAAKIIDSLLALSIIRKSEDGARYYSINIDDKQLSEIINGYVGKKR